MAKKTQKQKSSVLTMTGKCILGLVLAFLVFELHYVLRILWFSANEPVSTPYMRSEQTRLYENEGKALQYKWVDYEYISPYLIRAVVAAEDANFMNHGGVEWKAIATAFENNIILRRNAPGGSTLTQQTVKNLFLTHERNVLRKAQEIVLAKEVEWIWGKKRILEVYLNIAEFGDGIFGAEAAAEHYYRKPVSKLTSGEAVWLASILINPKNYQQHHRTEFLDKRIKRIQTDMRLVKVPQTEH